jgi:hypothetical protein
MAKRAYILGAGVSRGYIWGGAFPPTMPEFFEVANLINWQKEDICNGLLGYLMKRYALNSKEDIWKLRVNIEDLMCEVFDLCQKNGRWQPYWELELFIKHILTRTTEGPAWDVMDRFVASLGPGDLLVTFNYDCLLEKSLSKVGWRGDTGYGVVFDGRFAFDGKNDQFTFRLRGGVHDIRYYKLHGSLNWLVPRDIGNHSLVASPRPFFGPAKRIYLLDSVRYEPDSVTCDNISGTLEDFEEKDLVSLIIPPSRKKEYDEYRGIIGDSWNKAHERLAKCDELIFIGYSFPKTDSNVNALFADLKPKKITAINRTINEELKGRYSAVFGTQPIDYIQSAFQDYINTIPAGMLEDRTPTFDFNCSEIKFGQPISIDSVSVTSEESYFSFRGSIDGSPLIIMCDLSHEERLQERLRYYDKVKVPSLKRITIASLLRSSVQALPCVMIESPGVEYSMEGIGPSFGGSIKIHWSGAQKSINFADILVPVLYSFLEQEHKNLPDDERKLLYRMDKLLGLEFRI